MGSSTTGFRAPLSTSGTGTWNKPCVFAQTMCGRNVHIWAVQFLLVQRYICMTEGICRETFAHPLRSSIAVVWTCRVGVLWRQPILHRRHQCLTAKQAIVNALRLLWADSIASSTAHLLYANECAKEKKSALSKV